LPGHLLNLKRRCGRLDAPTGKRGNIIDSSIDCIQHLRLSLEEINNGAFMDQSLNKTSFDAAVTRGEQRQRGPRAASAHYDAVRNRVVVELSTGIEISFSPKQAQGLESARPDALAEIEITPSSLGLHFPKLDADIYIPALLEGILGSAKWMAGQMGRIGGAARSAGKSAAARENGKRGGRPRKSAA
jgi:Protein of unknown function (DUF2442)